MLCWLLFLSSCISFIVLDCDYDKNMVKKKKKSSKNKCYIFYSMGEKSIASTVSYFLLSNITSHKFS